MVKSAFIYNILDLAFDGDEHGIALRKQLPFIEEDSYQYTGYGVFVTFRHLPGIEVYKHIATLYGPTIKCPALDIVADTIIFIKDGLIDYLEIVNVVGVYPSKELEEYTMVQEWQGSPGIQITVTNTPG